MGWHINYEIVFENDVDWDDTDVEEMTRMYDCKFLYLRDLDTTTVMCCLYSQTNINTILEILTFLYHTKMKYRVYNTQSWTDYEFNP